MDRVDKLRQCYADATELRDFMETSFHKNPLVGAQFSRLLYRLRTGSCASVMDSESEYLINTWETALGDARNSLFSRTLHETTIIGKVAIGDMYSPVKQTISPGRLRWLKYWQLPAAHVKDAMHNPVAYVSRRRMDYPGNEVEEE
jgi:hypothetical protein